VESETWKTQKGLRDEIRRLEYEIKSTSKKMRDAETKYVNLAATPPKVQVRTVQVVSEEMKRKLEETVEQNRKQEDLLEQIKKEHSAKVAQHRKLEDVLEQTKMEHSSKVRMHAGEACVEYGRQ
jgi:seryl-tRNA synthetase